MQSRSYLFLLIVLILGVLSGWAYNVTTYNFGLDVNGGVRFIYEIDKSTLTAEQNNNMGSVRSNLTRILQTRAASSLGVVEANVQPKGDYQFIVELPGFADVAKAEQVMGSTASIEAYDATNVISNENPQTFYRPYSILSSPKDSPEPKVLFTRKGDTKPITPTDPEYKEIIKGWRLIIKGDDLLKATAEQYGAGYRPLFEFSGAGSQKMSSWSRSVMNRKEMLAFVLDGVVLSIAAVKDGTTLSDNAVIDGQFNVAYVNNLVNLLNAGALPVTVKELSAEKVDPTIGKQALSAMVYAGVIAFALVSLFLIVYYRVPGIMAFLSLCLYVLFTLAVLKGIHATFSLAAIAGFILSVGMAVDANILIFERIKEEIGEGKDPVRAMYLGFSRAFTSIFDSNACTIITSLVLLWFGTGAVKGFATTLMLGVIISLFTAVTVTRSLLVFTVGLGNWATPKAFGVGAGWFGEKFEARANHEPLPIIQRSKTWFTISAITILLGVPFLFMGGLKLNVEFQGGFELQYAVAQNSSVNNASIERGLEQAGIHGANVKFASTKEERRVYITVPTTKGLTFDQASRNKIGAAAGFQPSDERGFSQIGPSVQQEMITNAIIGVLLSSGLIVLYLAFRFGLSLGGIKNGFRFGVSAIGALLHDVLVLVGVAAIVGYFMKWEVSALFITAVLTVIGFSVHDTVVIFDRIRENLHRPLSGEDFTHLCNRSITRSIARSINTSFTVVMTLAVLILLGAATPELKFFVVAMLIGIVSGTYSSIYNATPILALWDKAIRARGGEEAGIIAESVAQREAERIRAAAAAVEANVNPYRTAPQQQAGYGQVKRRDTPTKRASHPIDDE